MTLLDRILHGDPTLLGGLGRSLGDFSINLILALIILVGALWASGWAASLAEKGIAKLNRKHDGDRTLQSFFSSLTRYVVIIVGLIAVLQQVGVRTTSIIAVLGAASLAVGLALQGALSNVAAGVMLLLFRPYRVGDEIEIGGKKGRVRSLDLFVTQLATSDNVRITAPNAKVFGDFILNHTFFPTRRSVVLYRVGLDEDLPRALEALEHVARSDPRVMRQPAPAAAAEQLGDIYVEVSLKAWSTVQDAGAVKSGLIIHGLAALKAASVSRDDPPEAVAESDRPQLN